MEYLASFIHSKTNNNSEENLQNQPITPEDTPNSVRDENYSTRRKIRIMIILLLYGELIIILSNRIYNTTSTIAILAINGLLISLFFGKEIYDWFCDTETDTG